MIVDLPGPLVVACHDAGAANLIQAWLVAERRADLRPVMEGPAAESWAERFGQPPPKASLKSALAGAAAVLSGTGWASDLEHRARIEARTRGLRSIAVVDHWTNYRERFVRGGATVLPDAIWVVDEWALANACSTFAQVPVCLKPNLYLAGEVERIASVQQAANERLLYVLEPARSDWGRGEPGEFQALDYLLANFAALGLSPRTPVRLRLHPSEPYGKYQNWLSRVRGFDVAVDDSPDLVGAIGRAHWVAGCQTAALAIALAAGRKVVSTLPPWAPACVLPHPGIVHLKALVSIR